MKRAHRRTHLLMWLILAPLMAAILVFSLNARKPAPVEADPLKNTHAQTAD